jgi:hypothetical protein
MALVTASAPIVTRLHAPEPLAAGAPPIIDITAPLGCCASVILKQVGHDARRRERYYSWWLVAGRDQAGAVSVPYVFTGEDAIRFDVPHDTLLSSEYLQKYLTEFWKSDRTLPPDTPIVKG